MTRTPLIVYLDTQDYIHLFNECEGGPAHKILEQLLVYRDRGDLIIGYSWVNMLEFVTKPPEFYREERVRRGQLIKEICGPHAFPFYSDLKNGARFPNDGIWLPRRNNKFVTAQNFRRQLEKKYRMRLAEQPGLNRATRKKLQTKSGMQQFICENISTWGTKRSDFNGIPIPDELLESGILTQFIKGRCSDAKFEERINRWFHDPAEFSRIVYDYADQPNLIDEFFVPNIRKIENALTETKNVIRELEGRKEEIHNIRNGLIENGMDKRRAKMLTKIPTLFNLDFSHLTVELEEIFGIGRSDHIVHYIQNASQDGYNFNQSDIMDIMQMLYVPDCNLFRCDKAMAHLYRDYKPFNGKLVAKFKDLPARIEDILCGRTD